ncbi:MAG: hypothetical protein R3A51_21750 [Nannocystaceae bacterium]|nr:hypothetical protein [Myxococcales bacterium]
MLAGRAALVAVAALLACGDAAEAEAPALAEDYRPARTWHEEGSSKPREAQSPYPAVRSCPATLEAPEQLNRTISQGCGVVRVRAGYRLEGGSLTLEPGVTLAFEPDAGLVLGTGEKARLVIAGTAEAPVLLTAAEGSAPGSWPGIWLYPGAEGSRIEHAVIERAGHVERSAVHVEAAKVIIEHTRLRAIAGLAVHVSGDGSLERFDHNAVEDYRAPVVMLMPPDSAAAIGPDNELPAGATVNLLRGFVRESGRWRDIGAPFVVDDLIDVAGHEGAPAVLSIDPGVELRFGSVGYINVGYYKPGEIRAEGTADAPVRFTSATTREPGAWKGVRLYRHARGVFRHAIFEYGAQDAGRGVLFANSEASLTVESCQFTANKSGVRLLGSTLTIPSFAGNRFEDTPQPVNLTPQILGGLAGDNDYGGQRVIVNEGRITRDTRWRASAGADYELRGTVSILGATLEIEAGAQLVVRDGFRIDVGERRMGPPASLQLRGAPGRPITFTGLSDKRGSWDSIVIHPYARGSVLEHVALSNAGGEAAVEVLAGGEATVKDLSCARCYSPALTWACEAQVTHARVEALDGTPAGAEAPRCE